MLAVLITCLFLTVSTNPPAYAGSNGDTVDTTVDTDGQYTKVRSYSPGYIGVSV